MAETRPDTDFTSETTDDCKDDARTQRNRTGAPRTDGMKTHAESRGREQDSAQPPVRAAGESATEQSVAEQSDTQDSAAR
jgi:hypothetical protein